MAKYLDMDGLKYLWEQIKAKLNNKVDKIDGKDLSTNDYTNADKTKLSNIEEGANAYIHPGNLVEAGIYKSVQVNSAGHVIAGSSPTTLAEYGIIDAANKIHQHGNDDITNLDASKLIGTIDIARLPQGALERLVIVSDDSERFALTTDTVQKGDTVKTANNGMMYFVVDDEHLDSEEGYEQYTASAATSVDWSGILNKPNTFPSETHTHVASQITDFPTSLKNPNALSLVVNGTTISYDGSETKSLTIDENALGITSITNTEIDTVIAQG